MREYHKIHTLYKRDLDGDKHLIEGEWSLPEFEYLQNNEWEFTEKVDGTNIRIQFERIDNDLYTFFGGRTDRAEIPQHLVVALNEQFLDQDLADNVGNLMIERNLTNIIFFGEGYGPKIQGGGKYRETPGFALFDVLVGDWWLQRDAVDTIADTLGLDKAPVVGYGTLHDAVHWVKEGMTSTWGDFESEGIVARPKVPLFDRKGQRIIAKIKGRDFR